MLQFELVTPEGVKFRREIYEAILPTTEGEIAILPQHAPLVALARAGVISIRFEATDTSLEHLATSGGLIEIDNNNVRFLADTAERADDIDELRAQEALERARELQHTAQDHVALADATRLIERNLARLKVAELRRRHHNLPN